MKSQYSFPEKIRNFTDTTEWTYAKTMPKWPHEYIVKYPKNHDIFMALNRFLDENDEQGEFYERTVYYFRDGSKIYWTMRKGSPKPYSFEEETIINRCEYTSSYEYRKAHDLLPDPEKKKSQA